MKIDTNKITFRKATIRDIDILIEGRIIFLAETYGTPSQEIISNLKKSLKDYFTRAFTNNSYFSWIAEYGNKPVGFSGLSLREQPGNFDVPNGKTGYILNMYTVREFRKNGVCTSLLKKLIEESKQLNLDRIELRATSEGEPLYRKMGFGEPHDKEMELKLT